MYRHRHTHTHTHTHTQRVIRGAGGIFGRWWISYGLDDGDGFTGIYLSPHSLSCCTHYYVQHFTYQSYFNKVV